MARTSTGNREETQRAQKFLVLYYFQKIRHETAYGIGNWELGIRNSEFEEISSPPRTPKSEPRIMMD